MQQDDWDDFGSEGPVAHETTNLPQLRTTSSTHALAQQAAAPAQRSVAGTIFILVLLVGTSVAVVLLAMKVADQDRSLRQLQTDADTLRQENRGLLVEVSAIKSANEALRDSKTVLTRESEHHAGATDQARREQDRLAAELSRNKPVPPKKKKKRKKKKRGRR